MAPPRARTDRRSPRGASYWLWMLAVATASLVVTAAILNAFVPADRGVGRDVFGQDFLAFYAAGRMVNAGDVAGLYDLDATARLQEAIAAEAGYARAAAVAPWLNPPHAALLFAPLAARPFRAALAVWTLLNAACLATAASLLARIVGEVTDRRRDRWLAAALLALAPPTIHAFGHGQNTMLSLLLLTCAVVAWRAGRPLWAGLACAGLCYKPQLAAVVGVALFATLGWRVLVGALLAVVPQLLAAVLALPGATADFLARVPANLHAFQLGRPFPWHRHATFAGFWRFLTQGNAPGETSGWVTLLAIGSMACVALALAAAWWRTRERRDADDAAEDRFIAATVLATPLLMPYFVDYDLALLAVAAVLMARDAMARGTASPGTLALGVATYVWLAINPTLAAATGVNLTVPLLVALFATQVRHCLRREAPDSTAAPAADAIEPSTPDRLAA